MLLGKAKHLHCLQESHSEKPAVDFPGISSWFYMGKGKGDLMGVCKMKGRGKRLLELLNGEQEPLFLGLWKISQALDLGHSCKCSNYGWKGRIGGKYWICGVSCAKCFETKKALLVWLYHPSQHSHTFPWDLPSLAFTTFVITQLLPPCSNVSTQIWSPLFTNSVALAKSLSLPVLQFLDSIQETLIQVSACLPKVKVLELSALMGFLTFLSMRKLVYKLENYPSFLFPSFF